MRPVLILLLALLTSLAAPMRPASAAGSVWVGDANAAVRLISATVATGTAGRLDLGLAFRLAPGWHIYWRSPGEAGFPPSVDWAGSDNLSDAALAWPAPRRTTLLGIDTIGYEGNPVLPLLVTLAEPGRPLAVRAAVEYLACADICVPYQAELALDLPAGVAAPSEEAPLLAAAALRVPGDGESAGIAVRAARLTGTETGPWLSLDLAARPPLAAPDLFLHDAGRGFGGQPRVGRLDAETTRIDLPLVNLTRSEAARLAGVGGLSVTLIDGGRSAELRVHPVVAAAEPVAGWAAMLAVALLGGLILNLMPCVLPVLALKLLSVGQYGGAERRLVRLGFLASALGILTAFLLLAGGALVVRAAGGAVGWGIQFQQPAFLIGMIGILVLFAANLWGWLAIDLPRVLADRLTATPAGALTGAFVTGMFATLLATPCSAPFVGTALGFALAGGPAEILTIFLALGLGLALPYLAVAALPGLVRWMPRPGRWMLRLRGLLGLALLGTAGWLLLVLAGVAGPAAALGVAAAMIAAAALLALRAWRTEPPLRRLAGAAVALLLAGAFVAPPLLATPAVPATGGAATAWARFAPEAIGGLVRDGRVVLVDVTADWCVTCKVNKALVLDRGSVAALLADGSVTPMRADWTRPDPAIAAYLAGFGRYGIPFNAVYGPAAPDGIALPELLTPDAVLDAVRRARG